MLRKTVEERFWDKVEKRGDNECWEWKGAIAGNNRGRKGYGVLLVSGKHAYAHRLSYTLHNGPIDDGLLVCHSCDNGLCVNPKHLWLGTPRDNTLDMCWKGRNAHAGRGPKGPRLPRSLRPNNKIRLTRKQIQEIQELRMSDRRYYTGARLTEMYNVSVSRIYVIAKGEGRSPKTREWIDFIVRG